MVQVLCSVQAAENRAVGSLEGVFMLSLFSLEAAFILRHRLTTLGV